MITRYFGFPRSGKTTLLTKLAIQEQRKIDLGISKYEAVYVNTPVAYNGIRSFHFDNLGKMDYHDCVFFIDEGRLFADCRDYKNFAKSKADYMAVHGHDRVDIHIFSHDVNDLDKSIRNVSENVIYVHKFLGLWTRYIRIPRAIVFPKESGDIIMGFRAPNFFENILCGKIFRRRPYYKYFDSWFKYGSRDPVEYVEYEGKEPKIAHALRNTVILPARKFLGKLNPRKRKKPENNQK